MDFNTQRKIVRRLEEAGKNPLLFLPCLIAKYAVILFMSACRAVDMALSDSEGNFLGIKHKQKAKKAYGDVPVTGTDFFSEKKPVRKAPLPFRPLWQRAMSLLLACAFVSMSAEITASAEIIRETVIVDSISEITSDYFTNKGYDLSSISELDLSTNYNNSSEYPVNVHSNALRGMNGLTTITLGYSSNMVFSENLNSVAPNATVFVKAQNENEYNDARSKINSENADVVWDKNNVFYSEIPNGVDNFKAYSAAKNTVILEWTENETYAGYNIYKYDMGKYSLIKSISSSEVKTVSVDGTSEVRRYEYPATSALTYAIRPYKMVIKSIDESNYTAKIASKRYSEKSSAAPLNTGKPTLTYTQSNKRITLHVKMPANSSAPSYYILFSRDSNENEFHILKKFNHSNFNSAGEYDFTDPNLYSGGTRSYDVIAYYDVFGKNIETYPDSATSSSTPEYTLTSSGRIDVSSVQLNPPQNLTVTPIRNNATSDCYSGWSLSWDAPEDSNEIISSISYIVYANGVEVARTYVPNAVIAVDDSNIVQGEDITFSVSAVCDGISPSVPLKADEVKVSNECVELLDKKGGNQKASLIFKATGKDTTTQYTIWGKSNQTNTTTRIAAGEKFKTFRLDDENCTANGNGKYTYTLTGLTNDVTYDFWITSNAANVNYPSKILSVTPSQAPQEPSEEDGMIVDEFENGATITWKPVYKEDESQEKVDGYLVTIEKIETGEIIVYNDPVDKSTYTITKLENDKTYRATIKSFIDVEGTRIESVASAKIDFTPTVQVDDVLNLTVTPSGKVMNISWTAVKNATEYILTRTNPDGSQSEIYKGNKTSFTDSYVDNNTVYLYKVKAVRTVDGKDYVSDYSSEQRGMITYSLTSVQGLTAAGGDGCVILKWDKVDGADGYYVQYSNKDANSWTTIANVGQTTFTHTGLKNGDVYDYRIIPYVTINNKEESADTFAQKVTGKAGINLPAPTDFTATAGDGQITLKWSAVKGAEGYCVYLVAYDGSSYLLDKVSKTTAIHTNLSNNTTFTYKVCAYKYVDDTLVEGDFSVSKTATVGIELNAPTDVTAKAGNEQITLSWKKSDGAEGYVVYAYNIAQMSFTPVGIVTGTSFVHTGLTAGREYTYMIAAYKNVNGSVVYSGYSLSVTATPTSSGGTKPSDNSSAEAGDYRIYITGTTPYGMSNSNIISAFAGKGAFNTDIDVRFTLSPDTVTSVQDVLNFYGEGIESFLIYPMDIAIYNAGTNTRATINPGYYMTLTIPVPDELLPYSEHISVVHVSDLGQLEILPSIHVNVGGVDCIQFTANSFSPYAFVVYLPEIGEDTSAGTPAAAQGTAQTSTSGQSAAFTFRNTYLPEIYRRRARNKVYRIVNR